MKIILIIILQILFVTFSFAQKSNDKAIDNLIDDKDFYEAIKVIKKELSSNSENANLLLKLGFCYTKVSQQQDSAVVVLEKATNILKNNSNKKGYFDARFYLARAYHSASRFDDAIMIYNELIIEGNAKDYKAIDIIQKEITFCENAKLFSFNSKEVKVINLENLNTRYDEHSSILSENETVMIFTSKSKKNINEDIFEVNILKDGFSEKKPISTLINTEKDDANCGLSPDGKTIYIVRNEVVYESNFINGAWEKPHKTKLPINSMHREAHMSISSDGNTIYFVSDRPGGYGGLDIYKTEKKDKKWSKPENLGDLINTPFDEAAPFIHIDNTLFFSSKGHNSMGGYDVFYSRIKDGKLTKPINLGMPTNSVEDDIYYFISKDKKRAYLTSTRKGGKGNADLYYINYADSSNTYLIVQGNVEAQKESKISVSIKEILTKREHNAQTINGGEDYRLVVKKGKSYFTAVESDGYFFNAFTFAAYKDTTRKRIFDDYKLEKIDIENVDKKYILAFSKKKTELKNASELFMETMLNFLQKNPDLVIDIAASKEDKASRQKKRTQTIIDFLTENGISKNRISTNLVTYKTPKNNVLLTVLSKKNKELAHNETLENTDGDFGNLEPTSGIFLKGEYTIQVGAFSYKLSNNHVFFRDIRGKVEMIHGKDGLYRYYYGSYKYQTDADNNLHIFQKMGFHDAFVRETEWYKNQ